ncbi:hypothetical protein EJB05_32915, partial [Eragrostis curvula]
MVAWRPTSPPSLPQPSSSPPPANSSTRRFGTGVIDFDDSKRNPNKIYALAQCTPDRTEDVCRSCLHTVTDQLPQYYITVPTVGECLGCAAASGMSSIPSSPAARFCSFRRPPPTTKISGYIQLIGQGNLPDGQEIAVKRLSQSSRQGITELKSELVLIARLHHKNLVRLLGVCLQEHEKILVYEYMPNKSLDTILFDPKRNKELDWVKRFKIICGIARGGLQYSPRRFSTEDSAPGPESKQHPIRLGLRT